MTQPAELDLDPYAFENLRDSQAFYREVRDAGPVVYLKKYGVYATGRYEEVREVMSNYGRFTSTAGIGLSDIRKPDAWRERSHITETEPPYHTEVRSAMVRILSPVVIRNLKSAFEAEAEAFVERALDQRNFDGVRDLVEPFVIKVVMESVGLDVPRERFADVVAIGDFNFNELGCQNELLSASRLRVKPIWEWYQAAFQRRSLIPGGIGERIYEAEDRGEFLPGTGQFMVRAFFRAGTDTSIASIGQTLLQLARHPAQFDLIRSDQRLLKSALEEGIRYDSAVRHMFRCVVEDTTLSGVRLGKDVKIGAFLGAANRDPRQWERADEFDVQRRTAGIHVGFGHGIHTCLGQMIARLESECLLGALARRARKIEVDGPTPYRLVNALRTLESLPLLVTPI